MAIQVTQKQDKFLAELRKISEQMVKGGEKSVSDGLYALRELLEEEQYRFLEFYQEILNPKLFGVLWLLRQFLGELWGNLGEDSSGFPEREKQRIIELTRALGQYIQARLFGEKEEPLDSFDKVLDAYFSLLQICNDELMQRGKSGVWGVL